jgi:hypothetical protein
VTFWIVTVLAVVVVGGVLWNAISYVMFLREGDGEVKSHRRPYGDPKDDEEK